MKAVYEIGREPPKPDPLRQIPVDASTLPDPQTVVRVRLALADHTGRRDFEDAVRELWSEK